MLFQEVSEFLSGQLALATSHQLTFEPGGESRGRKVEGGSAYAHAYQVESVPLVSRGERHGSRTGIALPRTAIWQGVSRLSESATLFIGDHCFIKWSVRNLKLDHSSVNQDDAMEELIHDVQDSPFPS